MEDNKCASSCVPAGMIHFMTVLSPPSRAHNVAHCCKISFSAAVKCLPLDGSTALRRWHAAQTHFPQKWHTKMCFCFMKRNKTNKPLRFEFDATIKKFVVLRCLNLSKSLLFLTAAGFQLFPMSSFVFTMFWKLFWLSRSTCLVCNLDSRHRAVRLWSFQNMLWPCCAIMTKNFLEKYVPMWLEKHVHVCFQRCWRYVLYHRGLYFLFCCNSVLITTEVVLLLFNLGDTVFMTGKHNFRCWQFSTWF